MIIKNTQNDPSFCFLTERFLGISFSNSYVSPFYYYVLQTAEIAAAAAAASKKRSPSDFLKSVLGRPVRVKLNSGIEYRGVLACLDGYLNIAMEQTEEYVDGQLKAKYGDCFIRGNNGTLLASSSAGIQQQAVGHGQRRLVQIQGET